MPVTCHFHIVFEAEMILRGRRDHGAQRVITYCSSFWASRIAMAHWKMWWQKGNMEKKSNWSPRTIWIFACGSELRNLGLLVNLLRFQNVPNHYSSPFVVSMYIGLLIQASNAHDCWDRRKEWCFLCNASALFLFFWEKHWFYHWLFITTYVTIRFDYAYEYHGPQCIWRPCSCRLCLFVLSCHLLDSVWFAYPPNF